MPGTVNTLEYEASPGRWRFSSATPVSELAGIVQEYWEVEGHLSPFRERILPNGYAELMVNLGPSHRMLTHTDTSVWEHSWFSGLHTRAIVIESLQGTHLVSARLHPLGALRLLNPGKARVANAVTDLELLLGPAARELRARLFCAESADARFAELERFLLPRLSLGVAPSKIVGEATRLIEEAHGNLRIASLHADLGVSRKQLWLRFAA